MNPSQCLSFSKDSTVSRALNWNISDSHSVSEVTTSICLDHLQPETPKETDSVKWRIHSISGKHGHLLRCFVVPPLKPQTPIKRNVQSSSLAFLLKNMLVLK